MLTTTQHSRASAGLTYVYPVLSRRSGGLSIGINLNPNNACNWRCVYCQVPDLIRGGAPILNLSLLESELTGFLEEVMSGAFFEKEKIELTHRAIRDIALSGNGEPTSSSQFAEVIEVIGSVGRATGLLPSVQELEVNPVKIILISNGSFCRKERVLKGLDRLRGLGGEVWFKLDRATESGIRVVNGVHLSPAAHLLNLQVAAEVCPVWLQTCLFALDGKAPDREEWRAYLDFLEAVQTQQIPLRGVMLYGLARPSMQPEAQRLSALQVEELEAYAQSIRDLGCEVKVSV